MFSVWRRLADLPAWMRVLMIGQVVNCAGALAWIYLALYLVSDRGLSASAAGFVGACFGGGVIAGNFLGGVVGDRFGLCRSLLGSYLAWIVLCLLVPVAPPALLAIAVCAAGLASGGSRPLIFALMGAALPADRRREGMALSRTATNFGYIIGPPLGALIAAHDFRLIFVFDALTSATLAAIVWRFVPSDVMARSGTGPAATVSTGVWRGLRAQPSVIAILLTVLVLDTVYRQILTPLPLMLRAMGEPALAFGILMAVNAVLIVAFEAPIAVLLRHRAALVVISAGYALVGAGFLVIAAAPGLATATLAILVITAGEMLYKPTATAHVADSAPAGMAARYQSLYGAASVGGTFIGPAVGGVSYDHIGNLIWPACGVVGLACAAALWRVSRRAAPAPLPA